MARILTKEERTEFCELFMMFRDAGESRINSYRKAKNDFISQGKNYPSCGTLMNWIKKGVPVDPKEETPKQAEPIPENNRLMKTLLRLYRRRSEQDIDLLVDQLFPELLDEEE